jgi:predicted lysophospholipase L1 biosynthesis ABC-type transport system permease subunit
VALPLVNDTQPLADGAVFAGSALPPQTASSSAQRYFLIRFAPGVDPAVANRDLAHVDPSLGPPSGRAVAVEIDRLGQIGWTPGILGVLLGALALVAVGHALVTSVRRRRRELAVLKVLGFDQRQLRATIAWQASVLAALGATCGIPVGILVGRLVWRAVAHNVGTVVVPRIPVLLVLGTIPTLLALVNIVAFGPARTAARTPAAIALRPE